MHTTSYTTAVSLPGCSECPVWPLQLQQLCCPVSSVLTLCLRALAITSSNSWLSLQGVKLGAE